VARQLAAFILKEGSNPRPLIDDVSARFPIVGCSQRLANHLLSKGGLEVERHLEVGVVAIAAKQQTLLAGHVLKGVKCDSLG
jgi:hypothetical protein